MDWANVADHLRRESREHQPTAASRRMLESNRSSLPRDYLNVERRLKTPNISTISCASSPTSPDVLGFLAAASSAAEEPMVKPIEYPSCQARCSMETVMLVGAEGILAGGGGVSVWESTIPAVSRSVAPWRKPRLKTAVSFALSIAELPVMSRTPSVSRLDCSLPGSFVANATFSVPFSRL